MADVGTGRARLSWTYWAWKFYDDPTGSSDEGLVDNEGNQKPSASVLAQTYAQAVAGTPLTESFDAAIGRFELVWRTSKTVAARFAQLRIIAGRCRRD